MSDLLIDRSRYTVLILLSAVLLLGFFLRFYEIKQIPVGFFADEAAIGYNAYKLLTTGGDEYNKPHPFYFQSFGDWRTPIPIYSMIPLIAVFGLNEFSVRFTMAIYGTATILFLYLFTTELFYKDSLSKQISLMSAFLLAISPWHIHFSRTGFEFTTMPFYLLVSLFLFFHFLNTRKSSYLIFASIFFVVTFYTAYVIQLVLMPFLFILSVLYLGILKTKFKFYLFSLTLFILGLIPFLLAVQNGQALTRFNSVSPLAQGKSLTEILQPMSRTYFDHFSIGFLFLKGDIDMPGHFITRHSVRGMGELYPFQLPLIIFGIVYLWLKHKKIMLFFLFWFILYPVGSTMVAEGPFAHRSLLGVIPFQIISAVGAVYLLSYFLQFKNLKIRRIGTVILISISVSLLSLSLIDYANKYFHEYPLYSSDFWGWQYGPRDIMKYFLSVENQYDDLYMSGEFNGATIFPKFYDPENHCLNKCQIGNFYEQPEIVNPARKQIFSLSPDYLNKSIFKDHFKIKQIIYYPNESVAFYIGEIVE